MDIDEKCSLPPPASSALSGAFATMKDRASIAKSHFKTSQFQSMKEKTSQKLQPSLNKVKLSASAAAYMGRERMQPALSRVKEGSTQGWSMLKTKLASAGPVAEKFQTMGLNVVHDFLGDTPLDVDVIQDARESNLGFLQEYKGMTEFGISNPTSSRIPRLLNRNRTPSQPEATNRMLSPSEQCFRQPYILGLIVVLSGDVIVLGRLSGVNRSCRTFLSHEKRLCRFCVRFGALNSSKRMGFWESIAEVESIRINSEVDYDAYLEMAKSKGECTELIMTDVRRTYGRVAPHKRTSTTSIEKVETDQARIDQLSEVLHALAGRFPDVGYCQGMDYIAAHILDMVQQSNTTTIRPVERAFWMLVALFETYGLRHMFCPGLPKLQLCCYQTQELFTLLVPALAQHFEQQHVMIDMFIVGWYQTLFLYLNVLPPSTLLRIWDIFLLEKSSKILIRVTLALFCIAYEANVHEQSIDQVMQFFNTFKDRGEVLLREDKLLFEHALGIKVTNTMLSKLQKQYKRTKKV